MSIRDPHTYGLSLSGRLNAGISSVKSDLAALQRRGGGTTIVTGSTSTVGDATTVVKGKVQLAGDFASTSTAAVPVIEKATGHFKIKGPRPWIDITHPTYGANGDSASGGWATSDIGALLNTAIAALPVTGGTIYIPEGRYRQTTTVTVNKAVTFVGAGAGTYNRAETLALTGGAANSGVPFATPATRITWAGTTLLTMFFFTRDADNRPVPNAGMSGIDLHGGDLAGIGIDILCHHDGEIKNVNIHNMEQGGVGIRMRTLLEDGTGVQGAPTTYTGSAAATNGEMAQTHVHNTQGWHIQHVHIDSPTGIEMIGGMGKMEKTSTKWNVCLNYFAHITLSFGWAVGDVLPGENTNGLDLWDGDNNAFFQYRTYEVASTGVGTLNHAASRSNKWVHVEAGGGFRVMPVDATSSGHYNDIQGYDRSNGEPAPVIDAGGHLTYIESGWGSEGIFFNAGYNAAPVHTGAYEMTVGGDATGHPFENASLVARTYATTTEASVNAIGVTAASVEVWGRMWSHPTAGVYMGSQSNHKTVLMQGAVGILHIDVGGGLRVVNAAQVEKFRVYDSAVSLFGAPSSSTNTGGQVLSVLGGGGAAPDDVVPELRLYANASTVGSGRSRADINIFAQSATGVTERMIVANLGTRSVVGTVTSTPLELWSFNTKVMTMIPGGEVSVGTRAAAGGSAPAGEAGVILDNTGRLDITKPSTANQALRLFIGDAATTGDQYPRFKIQIHANSNASLEWGDPTIALSDVTLARQGVKELEVRGALHLDYNVDHGYVEFRDQTGTVAAPSTATRARLYAKAVGGNSRLFFQNTTQGEVELATATGSGFAVLAGTAGGQTLYGGTASGEDLTLVSTAHATKGSIFLGTSSEYDGVNSRLGLAATAPAARLTLATGTTMADGIQLGTTASSAVNAFRSANDELRVGDDSNINSIALNCGGLGTSATITAAGFAGSATVGAASTLYVGMSKQGFFDIGRSSGTQVFRMFSTPSGAALSTVTTPVFAIGFDGTCRWGPGGTTQVDHSLTRTDSEFMKFGASLELVHALKLLDTGGGSFIAFPEQSAAPGAPTSNAVHLFAQDNGAGKTQLMARFPTGASQQVAIEP